ncbi:hypothetical protein BDR07DRAFT_1392981 [Suillus spraguei]|nr:hypothetical protein BDR07DRAFT_1422419 [Suillus spraguei]KAG2367578.1 hypothetical protein BDR07DRAFT_1392981 [Suillus spraguei]
MHFSFLTAIVALTTSIMSVTAGQPKCGKIGESCERDSDCCTELFFERVVCVNAHVSILLRVRFSSDAMRPLSQPQSEGKFCHFDNVIEPWK